MSRPIHPGQAAELVESEDRAPSKCPTCGRAKAIWHEVCRRCDRLNLRPLRLF